VTGVPKSSASRRSVSIPVFLLPDLVSHLAEFTAPGDDSLVFTGPKGARLRRSNFTRAWRKGTASAVLVNVRFQDLRHTGTTMAQDAAAIFRDTGDRHREGIALGNLGDALREAGRTREAAAAYRDAAAVFRETGDPDSEHRALQDLQQAQRDQPG